MKILVISGSFKDVYSPIEACHTISNALNHEKHIIKEIPFCDGGEYTFDILSRDQNFEKIIVKNVINPYGKIVAADYLIQDDTAHIITSQILRLYPSEDIYKNPLELTDFGYGQLILDAYQRGYKKFVLYFGGTSTVSAGIGTIQALGARFYDQKGNIYNVPIKAKDLANIFRVEFDKNKYADVEMLIVADGNAKSYDIAEIAKLKIGKSFLPQQTFIKENISCGIAHIIRLFALSPDKDFSGTAGGLQIGVEKFFSPSYILGGIYFSHYLQLEQYIEECDLVITGEGRFDNTACGKAPAIAAQLANNYNKPVIFICGQIEKSLFRNYHNGIIYSSDSKILREMKIDKLLTCQEYYDTHPIPESYEESISFFKERTPHILRNLFERENL